MYPIPDDFDLNGLRGSTIYEFCMNANQIRLKFNTGLQIVVEGSMNLRLSTNGDDLLTISPQSPSLDINRVVDSEVISIHLNQNRMNFHLNFANGHSLELIGDEPYECYRVEWKNREVIV